MADEQGNGQTAPEGKQRTMIMGEVFELSTPYKEGHQCTEREAAVLNQTRLENIGNNWRASVKEALKYRDENNGDTSKLNEVRQQILEDDAKYEFGRIGVRQPSDPVEREARAIAREAIKAQLAEEGQNIKDVDQEALENAVAATALQDDVMALARDRVESNRKRKAVTVVGLNLGIDQAQQPAA